MLKFTYEKGVYMLVSAISLSSSQTVFNTRSFNYDNAEITSNYSSQYYKQNTTNNREKLFDLINEWKFFCHSQIEKGYFDIIA